MYDEKVLQRKFWRKFFARYFLYGYVLLFAMLFLGLASFCGFSLFGFPLNLIGVIPLVLIVGLFPYFFRICFSTNQKWKFYKVNTYRLRNKPFSEDWFNCEMYEPCMRLIIKDLCREYGYTDQYQKMYREYAHVDLRLERKKKELLQTVINERNSVIKEAKQ